MPCTSSGLVSLRTRITGSPASPFSSASSAVRTIAPVAAPGGRQARGQDLHVGLGVYVRVEDLVELVWFYAQDGLLAGDEALFGHVVRHLERRDAGALGAPSLEHVGVSPAPR